MVIRGRCPHVMTRRHHHTNRHHATNGAVLMADGSWLIEEVSTAGCHCCIQARRSALLTSYWMIWYADRRQSARAKRVKEPSGLLASLTATLIFPACICRDVQGTGT